MQKKFVIIVGVLIISAGGFAIILAENTGDQVKKNTSDKSGGSKKSQAAYIKISPSRIDKSTNNMSVEIVIHEYGYNNLSYDNLTLCMYDSSGDIIQHQTFGQVGSLESNEFFEVYEFNVSVSSKPKYILVDHPELRNDSRIRNQIRVWNSGSYGIEYQESNPMKDDFGFPRNSEIEQCG